MYPVRSIIAVLSLFSSHLGASGLPSHTELAPEGPGRIEISFDERIEVHPGSRDIAKVCRADYTVKGCTDFPIERLFCNCEKRDGYWVINASVDIEAVIHMANSFGSTRTLAHEKEHISDLKGALRTHLESITSRRFGSQRNCRTFARFLTESSHLRVVMNDLRVKSNVRYGCSLPSQRYVSTRPSRNVKPAKESPAAVASK